MSKDKPPRDASAGEAAAQIDTLLAATLSQATELLLRAGEVAPFALRWATGAPGPEVIPPVTDEEFPANQTLLHELLDALRMEAEAGALEACAVAADVIVELPGEGRVDAVRVNVEHRDDAAVCAYLTYRDDGGGAVVGHVVRTPGDAVVFAPPGAQQPDALTRATGR